MLSTEMGSQKCIKEQKTSKQKFYKLHFNVTKKVQAL